MSYDELRQFVTDGKMAILDELFSFIADSDYDGIDQWAAQCERTLPIVIDKWREQNPGWDNDEGLFD